VKANTDYTNDEFEIVRRVRRALADIASARVEVDDALGFATDPNLADALVELTKALEDARLKGRKAIRRI